MNFRPYIMRSCLVFGALSLVACASAPRELVEARTAYQEAAESDAATYAPAELKTAEQTLQLAESSFDDDGDSYQTRALAYTAERRVQSARVAADTYKLKQEKAALEKEYFAYSEQARDTAMKKLASTQNKLAESQRYAESTAAELKKQQDALDAQEKELADKAAKLEAARKAGELSEAQLREQNEAIKAQQMQLAKKTEELDAEKKARAEAEKRLADAMNRLSEIAKIDTSAKETIITLGGEVVFKTGKSDLRPSAREKLNQVADVLLENKGKSIQVVGHTDSQGKAAFNQKLSEDRANSVRTYLVERGVAADRITAIGKGQDSPVASNDDATGRTENRRVEIIIQNDNNS